jgi:ABC-type glycerol-3-phosphate transport system permease component
MESVHKLEKTVAEWYKAAPHLPKGGQKWLADNVWWIVVIGVVLSVLGLFSILSLLFLAGAGLALAGSATGSAYGSAVGAALGGVVLISVIVSLAVYVIELILMAMAISPLKNHKKKGWDLLFLVALINVLSIVVTGLLGMNFFSIIWGLLWAAVGGYFLFEIYGHFGGEKTVSEKKSDKPAFKPAEKKAEDKKA